MSWVFVGYLSRKLLPAPTASPTSTTSPSSTKTQTLSLLRLVSLKVLKGILDFFWWLCFVVAMAGAVCYPFARLYLVVESFAGLRSVDRDVYKTVEWAEFIPHAG